MAQPQPGMPPFCRILSGSTKKLDKEEKLPAFAGFEIAGKHRAKVFICIDASVKGIDQLSKDGIAAEQFVDCLLFCRHDLPKLYLENRTHSGTICSL